MMITQIKMFQGLVLHLACQLITVPADVMWFLALRFGCILSLVSSVLALVAQHLETTLTFCGFIPRVVTPIATPMWPVFITFSLTPASTGLNGEPLGQF
jgi:hypothetical protein